MNKGFFITGTDTNVGKTIVSAILVNKFNAVYYKPIQCGVDLNGNIDSDIIKKLCHKPTIIEESYRFKNALSPNIASKRENIKVNHLNFNKLNNIEKRVIVEGAGGLQVPINESLFVSDLPLLFELPVILVCKTELGTINHTLMSLQILKEKKIHLAGLVFNGKKNHETLGTILSFGKKIYGKKITVLANIPFIQNLTFKKLNDLTNNFSFRD